MPIEDKKDVIRARVRLPFDFKPESFKFIEIDGKDSGIKAIVGILKKDKDNQTKQSYVFFKSKGWTMAKVKTWLKEHKVKVKTEDLTEDSLKEIGMGLENEEVIKEQPEVKPVEAEVKEESFEGKAAVKAEKPTFDIIKDEKGVIVDYQNVKIEGYANTFKVDRGNDLIIPGAFKKGKLSEFKSNPILLADHDRDTKSAVGKVTAIAEDQEGLLITAELSNAPDVKDLRFKVAERILRTFSIGGLFHMNFSKDPKKEPNIITKVELREISIVTVPMNQFSLFKVRSEDSDEVTTIEELNEELSKEFEGKYEVKEKIVEPEIDSEVKKEDGIEADIQKDALKEDLLEAKQEIETLTKKLEQANDCNTNNMESVSSALTQIEKLEEENENLKSLLTPKPLYIEVNGEIKKIV